MKSSCFLPVLFCVAAWSSPLTIAELKGLGNQVSYQAYDTRTIFDYIDGAAAPFLRYSFELLHVHQVNLGPRLCEASVEIYRMSTPLLAFGIYAQQRPRNARFVPGLGEEGYADGYGVFWADSVYYVQIKFVDSLAQQPAIMLAERLQAKICDQSRVRQEIRRHFPAKGLDEHSLGYAYPNALNLSWLTQAYTAVYTLDSLRVQAYCLETPNTQTLLQRFKTEVCRGCPSSEQGGMLVMETTEWGTVAAQATPTYFYLFTGVKRWQSVKALLNIGKQTLWDETGIIK